MVIWQHKGNLHLYVQRNYTAPEETKNGIALLYVGDRHGSHWWSPASNFTEVTFEDVESAFIKLGLSK